MESGFEDERVPLPPVDEDADIEELDRGIRRDLYSLPESLAEKVGLQLVMSARTLYSDSEAAVAHAQAARGLAPRVAATREALAIATYTAGDFKSALREARTVRRLTGNDEWLPMLADCERGLGRPERALEMLSPEVIAKLAEPTQAEALMVASGARADLGQDEAAVALLDTALLRSRQRATWVARLRFAYSEALRRLGDENEALKWLHLAVATDPDGSSGASERLSELEGVTFRDLEAEAEAEAEAGDAAGESDPGPAADRPAEPVILESRSHEQVAADAEAEVEAEDSGDGGGSTDS